MRRAVSLPLMLAAALFVATLLAVGCSDDSESSSGDLDSETVPSTPSVPDPGIPSGQGGAESPELEPYLGLTEQEAGDLADEEGRPWRVTEIDGEPQIVTLDFSPDRLNFAITGGVVTGVTTG